MSTSGELGSGIGASGGLGSGIAGMEGGVGAGIYGLKSSEEAQRERRERIATAVLAGLFTHNSVAPTMDMCGAAKTAVRAADALIAELGK